MLYDLRLSGGLCSQICRFPKKLGSFTGITFVLKVLRGPARRAMSDLWLSFPKTGKFNIRRTLPWGPFQTSKNWVEQLRGRPGGPGNPKSAQKFPLFGLSRIISFWSLHTFHWPFPGSHEILPQLASFESVLIHIWKIHIHFSGCTPCPTNKGLQDIQSLPQLVLDFRAVIPGNFTSPDNKSSCISAEVCLLGLDLSTSLPASDNIAAMTPVHMSAQTRSDVILLPYVIATAHTYRDQNGNTRLVLSNANLKPNDQTNK